MLNKRTTDFASAVMDAAAVLGSRSAPRIADHIMAPLFPRTVEEAGYEGCLSIFRMGVVSEVGRVLKTSLDASGQLDFASIAPALMPIVNTLGKKSYYVEAIGEHVPVPQLIADLDLLDDARAHMRRKGEENLVEANRLDELADAIRAAA